MDKLQKALLTIFRQRKSSNKNMNSYRTDLKELKLEVLLFTHFMYEDDDRLSLREKLSIVKKIRDEVDSLPEAVEDQFLEWANNPPSIGYILDYARENGYTTNDLEEATLAFIRHTDKSSKYHQVVRNVRKVLILEKDYIDKENA